MIKVITILSFLYLSNTMLWAQFVYNPGFGGKVSQGSATGSIPWLDCSGSPDIYKAGLCPKPGSPSAVSDTVYLQIGAVGSVPNAFTESVSQVLMDTLYPNKDYVFSTYCYSWYSNSCVVKRPYDVRYQVFIDDILCGENQRVLLSDSIVPNQGFWRKDTIVFRPNKKSTTLKLINKTFILGWAAGVLLDEVYIYELGKGPINSLEDIHGDMLRRRKEIYLREE